MRAELRRRSCIVLFIILYLIGMLALIFAARDVAHAQEPEPRPEYSNFWVGDLSWYRVLRPGESVTLLDNNGQKRIISYGGGAEIYPAYPGIFGIYVEPMAVELEQEVLGNLFLFGPPAPDTEEVDHPTFGCNVFEIEVLGYQNIRYRLRGADLGEAGRLPGAYLIYNGVAWAELEDQPGLHCYAGRGYLVVFSSIKHNKVLLHE